MYFSRVRLGEPEKSAIFSPRFLVREKQAARAYDLFAPSTTEIGCFLQDFIECLYNLLLHFQPQTTLGVAYAAPGSV